MVNKIFDNKNEVVKGINEGLIDLRKRYNESGEYGYAEFDFSIIGDDVLDAALHGASSVWGTTRQ